MLSELMLISCPKKEKASVKLSTKKLKYLKKPKNPKFTTMLVQSNNLRFSAFCSIPNLIPTV